MAARRRPSGLTLLEMLIAMSVMVIVVGTLSGLARAVHSGAAFSEGHGTATQHARVVLERITRTVNEATANESFPGFHVVAERVGAWRFPDTLVVWHPEAAPADPGGLPRFNELVIYAPDPSRPNLLLEITVPNDTRPVPPLSDQAPWSSEMAAIKNSASSRRVTLTNLMRTGTVLETDPPQRRGAVRFESRLRPSDDEWTSYQGGTLAWEELSWVQGIYGSQSGLRQAWLRIELQLLPGGKAAQSQTSSQEPIPFLGSAAVYYPMSQ
jgi:prepilin-type N-terminal cleavage/methylation domain-containing protein